jgi:hypothetical protein
VHIGLSMDCSSLSCDKVLCLKDIDYEDTGGGRGGGSFAGCIIRISSSG